MCLTRLTGKNVQVALNDDLSITVSHRDGRPLWESSRSVTPTAVVREGDGPLRTVYPAGAYCMIVDPHEEGRYRGSIVGMAGPQSNIEMTLILAIDPESDELLVEIDGFGEDTLVSVHHLYRFEKRVADGGYLVLPHGSGYLIPADCPEELPGSGEVGGFIGARWTLPLFGIVRGNDALCVIVDTWWDASVEAEHVPGDRSALDFNWEANLGVFAYPRRQFIRFATGMDYADMAKLYRERAREQGLLRTLEQKAVETPVIRRYVNNVLLRWPAWNPHEGAAVVSDLRRLREEGFGVNFFYPKWPSGGYAPERGTATTANAGWQAFLHPRPVPGGWPTLVKLERQAHDLGCVVQGFVCPISQVPEGAQYDEDRWPVNAQGERQEAYVSSYDALDRMKRVFDNLKLAGLKLDVLYYDGFSAHMCLPEDFSPAHPVSRRENIAAETACFAETRRRGIMPGAELARFWAIADCDYFFFTDWSADRLVNAPNQGAPGPVGEPVPLFQLVFHDCFIAGFSGGGYAAYAPGYDWWDHRAPRLYELMYASAPAYNWLPGAVVPIADWDSDASRRRRLWLKQWSRFYRGIAMSPMTSHRFLSPDRTVQRVEFASGVAAEFDMAANRFRVDALEGFSGEWQTPPEL